MTRLMDLVAGDSAAILLVIGIDDLAALDEPGRFAAHLALGGGLDPTWLDLFSEAVRSVTGGEAPSDFIDARLELGGPDDPNGRTIERVDPAWVTAVARIPSTTCRHRRPLDRPRRGRARRPAPRREALDPDLAGQVVAFCRSADGAPDVLFAWSLR